MANTEQLTERQIYGTLDTAGSTSSITAEAGELVDLSIDMDTNSFVGTITIERGTLTGASNIIEFQAVEAFTLSAERVLQSAVWRQYRLTVSAGPTGTAEFELVAGH